MATIDPSKGANNLNAANAAVAPASEFSAGRTKMAQHLLKQRAMRCYFQEFHVKPIDQYLLIASAFH